MKNFTLTLLIGFFISQLHAQNVELVYTVPVNPDTHGHTDGVVSEDSLLYVLTEHHIHILSYDSSTGMTEIQNIQAIDESLFIEDLWITEDWFYFVMHGNRSLQRIHRDDPNQSLEIINDDLFYPTALLAMENQLYFVGLTELGETSIFRIDLNGNSQVPELIVEDSRLSYFDITRMALVDAHVYVAGTEVLFKINTLNNIVEEIPMPGLNIYPALEPIGNNKLLCKNAEDLFVIDLNDNSYFFLGSVDCSISNLVCYGSELAVIDGALFMSGSESPDIVKFELPDILYSDSDNDKYGDFDFEVEVVANDYTKGFVMNALDCDDTNPDVNPQQVEVPYNGLDDDCDASTLDDDLDQDGYVLADDCDDANAAINPDVSEIPNNDIDEDCDGMDFTSSIHQLANTTINIYPNPVIENIHFDISDEIEFSATIYGVAGELIFSCKNQKTISFHSIPNGTYLIEIRDLNSGKAIVEKVVVEK